MEVIMTPSPDTSQPEQAVDDAPSGTLAIETHGLSKHFGQRKAVDGLTISIPAGTIAGFVGPNGAGKTTTIRLLLGLVRPSEGRATIFGKPLTDPRSYLPRVGALIEAPAFYPSLSGRTNLEVLAHLGGHPRSRVSQLLEMVELSDRAKDPVRKYSQGMKQRLGVAVALLPDPELVMLNHGKAIFSGPARDLLDRRGELVVEAEEATQLDLVARIATAAGYTVTPVNGSLRIACPLDWASELDRRAREAGATHITIRAREASLEERFLALLKGDH